MIKLNNVEIEKGRFPDNSQMLLNIDFTRYNVRVGSENTFFWQYEGDDECITLYYLVKHLREHCGESISINLVIPYIVNARMDRVKKDCEVFTLKYFADFINDMHFKSVSVLDAHSNVSLGLLNRVKKIDVETGIRRAICKIDSSDGVKPVIYFPDDGAMNRYKDLDCLKGLNLIYGKKNRDWETGKILGIEIYTKNGIKLTDNILNKNVILMIDDIISYGGTLAYSADKLKEYGAEKIYAYASHTENSILDTEKGTLIKRIENGIVNKVFTTDSIYSGNHPKIEIVFAI